MARPSHIECVLFDCDGVIVDSEPLAARRNMRIFHELGAPVTYEDCLGLAGVSGHREIPALFAKYGVEHSFEEFNSVRTDPAETPGPTSTQTCASTTACASCSRACERRACSSASSPRR